MTPKLDRLLALAKCSARIRFEPRSDDGITHVEHPNTILTIAECLKDAIEVLSICHCNDEDFKTCANCLFLDNIKSRLE